MWFTIPVLERSPGKGKGYPLQYSGLQNSMDCIIHGVANSQTGLSDFPFIQVSGAKFCFHPCFKTFFLNFNLVLKLHPFPFFPFSVKVKVAQLCPTLCNPMDYFSPWNSLDQNTGVGNLSLLQGILSTQESNPGVPHCRWILYQLSLQRSPRILE